jgi:retron-type reverse transcriptase
LKDTTNGVENRQLQNEGYLQEDRVELEDNAGVFSRPSMSEEEANGRNGYSIGLLEKILHSENMNKAFKRVKSNKGSHGIDGMTVDELLPFLKEHGDQIKQSIMEGKYTPKPVRRVEIPKPDGGVRMLGIPTVLDRVIQQAIAQILTPIYEREFSEFSYGFRPNRNAHQAVKKGKEYIDAGYKWAVDIDINAKINMYKNAKIIMYK